MEVFTGLSDLMTNGHIKGHLVLIMETQKINKYNLLLLASTYFSRIICWMVPLRFNIYPLIGTQPILTCKGRILHIGYMLEEMRLIWCALLMTTNRALKKREETEKQQQLSISKCGKLYALYRVKFTSSHEERVYLWDHNTNNFRIQLVMLIRKNGQAYKNKVQMNRLTTTTPQCWVAVQITILGFKIWEQIGNVGDCCDLQIADLSRKWRHSADYCHVEMWCQLFKRHWKSGFYVKPFRFEMFTQNSNSGEGLVKIFASQKKTYFGSDLDPSHWSSICSSASCLNE